MKFTIALGLMSLAIVLSAPSNEKRFLIDTLFGPAGASLFDVDNLKCELQKILDMGGTDQTEAACETSCKTVATFTLGPESCTVLCKGFQQLVSHYNIVPGNSDCTGGNQLTTTAA